MQGAGAISETILVCKPFFRTLLVRHLARLIEGKAGRRKRQCTNRLRHPRLRDVPLAEAVALRSQV